MSAQLRWELGSPVFGMLLRRYAPHDTYEVRSWQCVCARLLCVLPADSTRQLLHLFLCMWHEVGTQAQTGGCNAQHTHGGCDCDDIMCEPLPGRATAGAEDGRAHARRRLAGGHRALRPKQNINLKRYGRCGRRAYTYIATASVEEGHAHARGWLVLMGIVS